MSFKLAIDCYKTYGNYVNKEKMLPSIIDGLLPVQRRLLLVLHNIASKSEVKTVTANGELLGKYHPHAPSIGPATWAIRNKFAIGGGQWGSTIGIEPTPPSADRYTSIKAHPFIENTAMRYVKHVNWILNELDFQEPEHLPTFFPFCLMGTEELSSIGFGVKADFPIYKTESLYKRLLYLLRKTDRNVIIKPHIPNCDILSSKDVLKDLLTKGEATLSVKGQYTEDKINKTISIHGWSPKSNFENVYKRIGKYNDLIASNSIAFIDESNEKNGTKIKFEVIKQRNTQEIYNEMKNAIDSALTANVRYSMYVVDENKSFRIASVDEMLLKCYDHYKTTYKKYCAYTKDRYEDQLKEVTIIEKLRPIISELRFKSTIETIISDISKQIKETEDDVKAVIEKYNIKKLLTVKVDKPEIENNINQIVKVINSVESYIIKEYENAVHK